MKNLTSKLEERDDIIKALQGKLQLALGKELVNTDEEDNQQEEQQSVDDKDDKSKKDNASTANENKEEHGNIPEHSLENPAQTNLVNDKTDNFKNTEQENDSTPINGNEIVGNPEEIITDDVSLTDSVNPDNNNDAT